MKRLWLLIAGIMISANLSAAIWGGANYSVMIVDLSKLNAAISDINHTTLHGTDNVKFNNFLHMVGAQGGFNLGKFSASAWASGLFKETRIDSMSARFTYGIGGGSLGFQFEPLDWLWLRPEIDVAGSWIGIDLAQRRSEFGLLPKDTLIAPYRYEVGGGQFNLGGGVLAQFNVPTGKYNFLGLSLKAGYLYPIYKSSYFDEDGREYEPVKGFGVDGLYLRVGVNFGTRQIYTCDYEDDDEDNDWEDDWQEG